MPVVVATLSKRRKAPGTKPSRMQRRSFGKEGSQVVGMTFTQDFHLTMDFANDNTILEFFVRMEILTVLLNPFCNRERELALNTVGAERGDTKEGRELVGHGKRSIKRRQNN